MKRSRYIWLALLLVLMAVTVVRMRSASRERSHIMGVRDSVHVLRAATDSCTIELERRKAEMNAHAERVDSLRERVRALESLRAGGVPADSYDIYLAAFEGYNDGAAAWDGPAGALRATLQSCRDIAARHNLLVDSLRGLLRER